jgi:MFS family permease
LQFFLFRSPTTDSKARKVALVPLLSVFTLLLAASIDGLWMGMFFGVMTGLFVGAYQVAGFTILATLYGRKHIGSIQALISGLGILGVATGPLVLGIAKEMLGSYTPCLAVLALFSLVAIPLTATMPAPRRGKNSVAPMALWRS